jgi:pimeloyl-ACP methyl ester carboxylesterase
MDTAKLLILAGVILLVWGTFAPVGTLVWWLSQSAESLGLKSNQNKKLLSGDRSSRVAKSANIDCYIIYLSGVGDFSANQLTPGEEIFLNRLVQLHPNCVAVSDVFPYSAANEGLGGQRLLAPLWRAAENADGWLSNADILIKIRNLWRFAISADERYGEVYNLGIANAIIDRMNAAHPIPKYPKERLKVILIGTSGGVQVALGAASYLDQWLNARLIVVSVGGSFDGETGFESVDHVYHLQGSRDWVEDITSIVFASRWPITVASPFNQARQLGRYTVINTGPHAHDGAEGYFGTALVGESQTKYVELTLKKVNQLPIWSEQSQGQ